MDTFLLLLLFSAFFIISIISKANKRQQEANRQHQENLDQKRIQFGPESSNIKEERPKEFISSRASREKAADQLAKSKQQQRIKSKEAELYDQDDFFAKYDKLFDDDNK